MKPTFKFLSYNIHRGLSTFRRLDVCEAIADLLASSEADMVCLQEVWQHDGLSEHQLEVLCNRNWDYQVFEKNAVFPNGAQGNAVLSRFPVLNSCNIDITVAKLEPRGFLHTEVDLELSSNKLNIINVHLGLFQYERVRQLHALEMYISNKLDPSAPLILAGDFNDWRARNVRSFAKRLGLKEAIQEKHGNFGRTYPSFRPMLRLDRIYFRNCELKASQVVRYMNIKGLSDHLPIEAIFYF